MRLTKKAAALLVAAAMVMSMGTTVFADETGNGTGADDTTPKTTETGTADNNYETSLNTTVKYEVTESYTWQIHSAIDFGKTTAAAVSTDKTKSNNEVKVSKSLLPNNTKLQIKIEGAYKATKDDTSSSGFTIATDEGATRTYTVTKPENTNVNTGDVVLEVKAGVTEGSVNLTYTLQDVAANTAEKSGTYNGTVTYSAAVVADTVTNPQG